MLHGGGELYLCSFRRVTQALQGHLIAFAPQIETLIFLEFLDQPVDDSLVDVIAAEMRVAVGRFHLDDAFADLED